MRNLNITTLLLFGASACSVGDAKLISGTDGVSVTSDAHQTVIRLDEDRLAEQVAGRPSLREQMIAALKADPTFQSAAAGPRGEAGAVGPTGPEGEPGPPGRDADEARTAALEAAVAELRDAAWCPRLVTADGAYRAYAKDLSTQGVVGCRFGDDEMVKVGSFWIDRYEASLANGALGTSAGQNTTAAAASVREAQPQGGVTWFQAAAMCANAGKRLCTNAEWQTAVAGTFDPGAFPGSGAAPQPGACNTSSSGVRFTGRAGTVPAAQAACISRYGAEDMIGNVTEWVADWGQSGRVEVDEGFGPGAARSPWPAAYGGDATYNVNGDARIGLDFVAGMPGA